MNVNLDSKTLIQVVEGKTAFDHSFFVQAIKSLGAAGEYDLAFVFDPEDNSVFSPLSLETIKTSKAGAIIASKQWVDDKNFIIVNDPLDALNKIIAFKQQQEPVLTQLIHSSAHIAADAKVGEQTKVGCCAVIESGVIIGNACNIEAQVFIGRNCIIGNNVTILSGARIMDHSIIGDHSIIHSGVVIGSDGFGYRVMKTGLRKIPQVGVVRVGMHVEIGANACIDRAAFDETVIGDGCKLDNMVHIAHNVQIGASTVILAQTGIAGSVRIGVGCQIGGQVAIRDHVIIGNGVKIVSKSAVMQDLKDGEVVAGIPSMPFLKWKRLMVALSKLPELAKQAQQLEVLTAKLNNKGAFWKKIFRFGK